MEILILIISLSRNVSSVKKRREHQVPDKQLMTIYSLNAALFKLIFQHFSKSHYYFLFEVNWV